MSISIIVARTQNGVIGNKNEIPWYMPRDLKHFAAITKNHTVIMGRKTHDSIMKRLGHPLPDRKSIIITRQKDFQAPGCIVVGSWDEAIKNTGEEEVFVSGGNDIYKLALPHADKIYLTLVDAKIEGDTYFTFDESGWKITKSEFQAKDEKNPYDCTFYEYERKN